MGPVEAYRVGIPAFSNAGRIAMRPPRAGAAFGRLSAVALARTTCRRLEYFDLSLTDTVGGVLPSGLLNDDSVSVTRI